ncbi:MAG: aminotransferase class V-fold PLP-dependent enzyme [Proteobacteria bacterium]|nr:aminotransferase class V-fold PLP-dependent enzyme [Pseudomonadota bacterium]
MIYLDNAATTYPKPESVYKRVDYILREVAGSPGRAAHSMAMEASRVVFEAREVLASLLQIEDSSRIAFTRNATEAINIALKGLLEPGDHLITTAFEHNSVARPARVLETRGVSVTRVSSDVPGVVGASDIEAAITEKTKLVCVTHASNVFGTLLPVKEIGALCRARGILFMVDGSQTVGALPVNPDELNIDILAGTGHKALFGLQGTGFLYLTDGVELPALVDGGTGEVDDDIEMPDRLEAGTMNMPGIGGLGAGIEFLFDIGLDKVRAHEKELITTLIDGIKDIEGLRIIGPASAEERVALLSFTLKEIEARDVGIILDEEYSILVRCGTHCAPQAHKCAGTFPAGTIRVGVSYFNTLDDIERFIEAIKSIIKSK